MPERGALEMRKILRQAPGQVVVDANAVGGIGSYDDGEVGHGSVGARKVSILPCSHRLESERIAHEIRSLHGTELCPMLRPPR